MKSYKRKFKEDIIPTEVTFNTDASKVEEQILRTAIASELGAINLYQQMIDNTQSEEVRKILQDIIDEEKVHVGEFELILSKFVDNDNSDLQIQGAQEAEKVVNENFIKYKRKFK
jgi:rubrerythrin